MYFVGVDIGQRRDHTAIAVVERVDRMRQFAEPEMECIHVRHVERVPPGTPFPMVVERVREVLNNGELEGQCVLVVDATGVGAPVVEMMRSARFGCEIAAVTITGGDRETQRGQDWSVPKRDLIAGVQMLLDRDQLKIARGMSEAGPLVEELADVRAVAGRGEGKVRYGAEGAGQHDDLAIALALAVWRAMKRERRNGFGPTRLPGI